MATNTQNGLSTAPPDEVEHWGTRPELADETRLALLEREVRGLCVTIRDLQASVTRQERIIIALAGVVGSTDLISFLGVFA